MGNRDGNNSCVMYDFESECSCVERKKIKLLKKKKKKNHCVITIPALILTTQTVQKNRDIVLYNKHRRFRNITFERNWCANAE